MTIILVGLNHRTAPVELREKLALTGCSLTMALEELRAYRQPGAQNGHSGSVLREGAIISTCNRLEVYALVDDAIAGWAQIERFLAHLQNIPLDEIYPHLYQFEGEDAVNHLMQVACGLDSMILGETQILGQVTQAYSDAQTSGLVGPILSNLFSRAIHAGKKARTDTDISRYTTSVSHAGALMVIDKITVVAPNILVIGAGEMAILAAKALQKYEMTNLAFINRTYARAEALSNEVGGEAMSWHQLGDALFWADAVITATGAPHTVIHTCDIKNAFRNRGGRKLLFVDIAVPRDVEVAVGELDGVERYDIDDLQSIVDSNTAQRKKAIPTVNAIIKRETTIFFEWYHSRQVTPVIKDLRRWATEMAQSEVDQALNKLGEVDDQTAQVVNRLAHRLVNKLLHEPTVRLRGQAADGNGYGYAHAISELFGLDSLECEQEENKCRTDSGDASCNLHCIATAQK